MHFERLLLVSGDSNAGKSTLMRSLISAATFSFKRPTTRGRLASVPLSAERCLFVRVSSPHESGLTQKQFFQFIDNEMKRAKRMGYTRFNFASALQQGPLKGVPLEQLCRQIQQYFGPERIRLIHLYPTQVKTHQALGLPVVNNLWRKGVEVATIDSRIRTKRATESAGYLLADFFDFT
jgi:hypothetical protein